LTYYLTKVLPLLLMPISLALAMALVSLFLVVKVKRRASIICLLTSLAILWVSSMPVVAGRLLGGLEGQYLPVAMQDIPSSDCIVVLGGAVGGMSYPRVDIDLTDSSDRVYQAAKLYRARKASIVIVAAGNQPWNRNETPEAELINRLLMEWGVPQRSILLDTESKTTRENATNAAVLLRETNCHRNLLVTSAWHMPRAVLAFRLAGVEVIPVSTDVRSIWVDGDSLGSYIPQANALARTSHALKEWMGIWVYEWGGRG
jgi:uncharacterized SAM-binding protein YcdF (DUF218 family)